MNPPGCPMRRVTEIHDPRSPKLFGFGKMLKLECGHEQWEAGFDRRVTFFNLGKRPCLGGCYEPQRAMGDQHGF